MKAYTLKQDKDSGELHLFEGDMLPNAPEYIPVIIEDA